MTTTNRRRFLQTATIGSAAMSGMLPCAFGAVRDDSRKARIDPSYLSKGVNWLARVHRVKDTMRGHWGTALIAGYFFGLEQPDLDDEVYQAVEADLKRFIGSYPGRRNEAGLTRAEMCAPFTKEKPDESLIDGIAEALEAGIDKPRQSGHNVIFASAAIRALKAHPNLATPSVIDGIRKHILQFKHVNPGAGYYGKERGLIRHDTLKDDEAMFPMYEDLGDMATAVFDALAKETPEYRRSGWGGLIHITNHAAGLVELAEYGYEELAAKGLAAHHRHLRLWLSLPNVMGDLPRGRPLDYGKHHPHTPEFWRQDINLQGVNAVHRVKSLYGFGELVKLIRDEDKRKQAEARMHLIVQRW